MNRPPRGDDTDMTAAELRQLLRRVGIWMPPPERAGIDPAKTAAAIEGAGFTSVWVGGGNATPDALDRLRPLLAGSENLIVATGIANVWAWDPARLRAAAAALAADFPDRFILGLGVSHEPAVTALGHPYQRPLRKMEKFLDELDHPAEHGSDRYLPPVVLAALGPKMLELSRAQTAGAHPYFTTPEHTAFARSVLGNEPLLVPEQAVSLAGGEAGRGPRLRGALPAAAELHPQPGAVRLHACRLHGRRQRAADLGGHPVRAAGGARHGARAPGGGRRPRGDPAARRRRRVRAGRARRPGSGRHGADGVRFSRTGPWCLTRPNTAPRSRRTGDGSGRG